MEYQDKSIQEHDCAIQGLKERFLAEKLGQESPEFYDMLNLWSESREAGIDHTLIPSDTSRDFHVYDRVSDAQKEHLDYLSDYYMHKHATLAGLGCAIFYIDAQGAVFSKAGNKKLLDELRDVGIRNGTLFDKEHMGANAITEAMNKPFTNQVFVGHENYLDVLTPYACIARFAAGGLYNFATSNLIIMPLTQYSEQMRITAGYILETEDISFRVRFVYPLLQERMSLIEKSSTLSDESFLLTDEKGNVVFTSPCFEKEFARIHPKNSMARPLSDYLPELEFTLKCLKDGHSLIARETMLANSRGESSYYYIDCFVINEQGKNLGLKITVRTANQISPYADAFTGSSPTFTFDSIKGNNTKLLHCKELAFQASKSVSNVLITGESGTGKELFAQAIHSASNRRNKPFISVNCGAIPKELVGSELFGYEEGAFTGARRGGYRGKFEQAKDGTIFLDEIGEMPLDVQTYLLKVLDSGVITRLAGKKAIPLNVRVVAATNKNLWECVNMGSFRLDLFFRLNVLSINLPPLRESYDDIGLLTKHFATTLSPKLDSHVFDVAPDVISLFEKLPWPGNVRQLRNAIEQCINLMPETADTLTLSYVPENVSTQYTQERSHTFATGEKTTETEVQSYHEYEKNQISQLLIACRGNKSKVAETMGISRGTLYNKIREYNLY